MFTLINDPLVKIGLRRRGRSGSLVAPRQISPARRPIAPSKWTTRRARARSTGVFLVALRSQAARPHLDSAAAKSRKSSHARCSISATAAGVSVSRATVIARITVDGAASAPSIVNG